MKSALLVLAVFAVLTLPIYALKIQRWNHADCTGPPAYEIEFSNSQGVCQPSAGPFGGAFFRMTSDCSRSHDITYNYFSDAECTEKIGDSTVDRLPSWGCYNFRNLGSNGYDLSSERISCSSASTIAYSGLLVVASLIGLFLF